MSVSELAQEFRVNLIVAQYHLEQLEGRNFVAVTDRDLLAEEEIWTVMQLGRRYIMENGLHKQRF